ncbi:MAG: hypothetical protein JXR64_09590 [Spirochaetales bacterium]|nr:hypothetical protein [Spirochaetales bacterium]
MKNNLFIFFMLLGVSLFSQVPEKTYILRERSDYRNLELLPAGLEFEDEFKADILQYAPEVCVEMLYILDLPKDNDILTLLNKLLEFSKQEGIEYFSNRRQAMHLLIEESYFVGPDGKSKISDPVIKEIGPVKDMSYFQKDTTFESNYYKLKTVVDSNSFWLQMENLNKLTVYKVFKALDKGGQRTNFIVHKGEDKLYVYALAQIKEEPKLKKILTYNVNIPYSFERRMNSIMLWYKDRL